MTKEEILQSNLYLNLATVRDDGQPWNTPLFYYYDGLALYWWSDKQSVHSGNVRREARAFITIYDSRQPVGNSRALYIQARVEELADVSDGILSEYSKRAAPYVITRELCTGPAEGRMYKAIIQQAWTNAEGERGGQYIDIREEVA
jgi:uncharacterized protein YhbP (UPF0306 family)